MSKKTFYAIICMVVTFIVTEKLAVAFYGFVASTNDTSAPFAALIATPMFVTITFVTTRKLTIAAIRLFRMVMHGLA